MSPVSGSPRSTIDAIAAAVATIVERGEPLTSDLGGTAGSKAVAEAVRADVQRRLT